VGASTWKDALPLWFDAYGDNSCEYRGSIVNLLPDTSYEIQLTLAQTGTTKTLVATTWSENPSIAQTIYLPANSGQTLVVNDAGTPDGYVLYTFDQGIGSATIDVNNNYESSIEITGTAQFVIIRGLTLRGGSKYGIRFTGAAHNIIIEENDISGWGTDYITNCDGNQMTFGAGRPYESGISAQSDAPVERIIVQRNKIHHPRSSSNSWYDPKCGGSRTHPSGPNAIHFYNSKGNHVIRYNEVYSDPQHYFQDGFGAGQDDGPEGFPNRDSDIYANYIANVWDDGIQAEGGNQNVRVWGNFIEHTFTRIAVAPTAVGPVYIWRNIGGASRHRADFADSDDYGRGQFLKTGGDVPSWQRGGAFIFHNTDLNPVPTMPNQILPLGGSGGIKSSGGDTYDHLARNNIFTHYTGGSVFKDNTNSCTNDLDYNLFHGSYANNCSTRPHESNGYELSGTYWWDYLDGTDQIPFVFDPASGTSTRIGYYPISQSSGGIDTGEIILNFNDEFTGGGPDIGAFETGQAPMEFGVYAYLSGADNPTDPYAIAGSDQTISDGDDDAEEWVIFDGSASFDPDGTIVSYEWTEGTTILGTQAIITATFTLGVHIVTLTVIDNDGNADKDTVMVTVDPNQPPVADAGPDQFVEDGDNNGDESVTLDGSASYDSDGTIISYEWIQNGFVIGTDPTLTAIFSIGTHTVTLNVTDNAGSANSDEVVVTVDQEIFLDDFETASENWGGFGSGWNIQPAAGGNIPGYPGGNFVMHADDCNNPCQLTMTNSLDLGNYESATLGFWRYVDTSLSPRDYLKVEAFDGASWSQIFHWTHAQGDDDTWRYETFDLSSFLVNGFKLRFSSKKKKADSVTEIDDVKITGVPLT
jgi:hypothetical protein